MRLQPQISLLALLSTITFAYKPESTHATDELAAKGLKNLEATLQKQLWNGDRDRGNCNMYNVARRREWSTLSIWECQAYSNAVLCLMKSPAQTDQAIIAGARTRYDDFVWVHINQTLTIHGTGNFLSWHRYYTWAFEQALRDECGYKGYQPYWNWGKSAKDPMNSPYFDGSPWSMSGNGVYQPHNDTPALPPKINNIPAGQGGGCVNSGPFKNMSVNLGPVSPTLQEPDQIKNNATINIGSAYNPRCLKRDISSWVSSRWSTDQQSVDLITNSSDIATFQSTMQGDFNKGFYGVHTAGHFTYGGDPAGDLFTSPGDPAFWIHHGQIDRTWWIWQNLDLEKRSNAIAATITINNNPPSRNATLGDAIWMGVVADTVTIGDVMSTVDGPLCYIYV